MSAKALMITGTCSDAGKSVITAALLRIASNAGIKVAPFKAQNMALNSYVTIYGEEIGRSTAVQAKAARVEADWRMNPVLLKPVKETASQVVIKGKALRNMEAKEYFDYKKVAWKAAREGFDSLAKEYDLIIMEGAGSPAEINLWDKDIVNMPMAEYAKAKVLLVGEIDRGGVFASIYGTIELFPQKWKDLMLGFILNRFRGDSSFLYSGIEMLEDKCKIKSYGIVPFTPNMGIPEEDSVKQFKIREKNNTKAKLNIAIIVIPHISNFTDFEPFLFDKDINIEMIAIDDEINNYDIVFLPGSKSTIKDLKVLKEKEFGLKLKKFNGCLFGICGGLQMMGNYISDPNGLEGELGKETGFKILDFSTEIEVSKILERTKSIDPFFGLDISGYEIHQGRSTNKEMIVGEINKCGTYLHGVFDSDLFRNKYLSEIYFLKHNKKHKFIGEYNADKQIDNFAELVSNSMDVKGLFKDIDIEV